jgi:hypothetical protein
MAKTVTTNVTSNTNIHSGAGSIISLIINHSEATTQTVTIYDSLVASGTVLAAFKVAAAASPSHIKFDRPFYMRFTTGLTVSPGNCSVLVTSVGN